ncbi:unnamed protein product, partial [Mesorhabditis belari]|uniref:Phospholipid/glycerol acyltransferase domain-containing protein n=1 Tax=Mesorhabditis belari TaxID=2138241 RepID=A0AAF3FCW7_9BILA
MVPMLLLGMNKTWRHNMDRAVSLWMTIPMCFLEWFFGVTIRVCGDPIEYDEPAMILMNHRTRLDWMYIWSALFQINPWLITSNKISMKKELKFLPGAGFGMSANQFIFLERNIEKDKESFENTIEYYASMKNNYQVLLFPEGTDKTDWTTAKSNSFAKKNGLSQLEYVLYPRVAGFNHLLNKNETRNFVLENYISYIYDITIGYPYKTVQTEIHLVAKGDAPKEVHFHVKKIPISEIPRSDTAAGAWLTKLWLEKEERLRKYYAEPRESFRRFESNGFSWSNV